MKSPDAKSFFAQVELVSPAKIEQLRRCMVRKTQGERKCKLAEDTSNRQAYGAALEQLHHTLEQWVSTSCETVR